MQIPSVPPPIVTNAIPQDVVARAVPNLQAATPLLQNAVPPAPKSEKSTQSRSNRERDNGKGRGQKQDRSEVDDNRGQSVNISV